MSSVTQQIPNFKLGISELPDELKTPGQVVDLNNGIPDITRGLIKRPGSDLVKAITPAAAGKWFPIYREEDEQYIGQVARDGSVKIWRCSDGAEIPVDYANVPGTNVCNYLIHTESQQIQPITVNETILFANRTKTVAMLTDSANKSPAIEYEAFINLRTISYGKQYSLDIFDPTDHSTVTYNRATGLEAHEDVDTTNITGYSNDGKCQGMNRSFVRPTSTNSGTSYMNGGTGKSNLCYEMDTRCTPVPQPGSVSSAYDDSYQPTCTLQFGGEGWTTNDTHTYESVKGLETQVKVTAHVAITARANIALVRPEPTASNNEENVSAESILAGMKNAIDSISGTGITATICGNGLHLRRATPFGITTTETNLMEIITNQANDASDLPKTCRHGYVVEVVNSGEDQDDYHLKFKVNNIGDETVTGTYARSGTTITITKANHGLSNGDTLIADFTSGAATDGWYTVANKTTNTFEVTDSASGTISAGETVYFQPARFGEGVWEEVCEPGIQIQFDNDTMPLSLTRVLPGTYAINGGSSRNYTNGTFKFQYPDWGKRDVGDDITNAPPSFVGYPIQKMLFFRNRIALLSAENVILSRVNDFYNFWVKTAMAISNADPIDLQSSSTYPTKLFDAVETNTGLVIYSASEQFLLSSGAEALLTPETAKISFLASYAFNPDTNPISLGTTIGWINSTAKNARFYEMAGANTREEPQIQEQSKIVAELFPTNITLMDASPENSLLLFGTDSTLHTATKEVWGYKFHQTDKGRNQSAFFRWTFPNNIIYQCILDDKFYLVLNNGSKYTLEKLDIKLRSDTDLIGDEPDVNRVYLDTKKTVASGDLTYNTAADTTTFTLGSGYYSSNTLTAYCVTSSDARGKSYDIKAADITGTAPNETVTLPGNWKTSTEAGPGTSSVNTDLIIGYEYEFEVELPKIYLTRQEGESSKAETRGSLVLHRMNFDFGDVGVIDVTLKRKGRSDYTYTVESLEWDNINASEPAIADGYMHTIPVYDRNINTTVILKSNHPSPSTLNSMNWEGDYSPRYYRRV